MRYSEAKKVKPGDTVVSRKDNLPRTVLDVRTAFVSERQMIFFQCSFHGKIEEIGHIDLRQPMSINEEAARWMKDPRTRVEIVHTDELGEWLYSVQVVNSDGFWLGSFETEEAAEKYIRDHKLKKLSSRREGWIGDKSGKCKI